ncbi:pyridoxal-phosphate-dependent aminotransferase family protein [Desmospora profundinema]|nr:alanine--glyoxylate aminotransferase family protein [Desmospora profundinema]
MLRDKVRLQIPGPTPIPPRIQQAMLRPMVGHRDPEASKLVAACSQRLAPLFGTASPVLIMAASGTAALEAAVINSVQPGGSAAVVVTGAFGDRFAKILGKHGIETHRLDIPWGQACTPEALANFLKEKPQVEAVFLTFCETSTGVLNPIDRLASVVREHTDALVIADGVSAVGGVPAHADEWGVDILVTGSQKALMLPAGLAFASVSSQAWERIEANARPRFYLDFLPYRESLEKNTTPYTPAVSLLFGLEAALDMLEEEGLENVYTRHQWMMRMTRAGIRGMGLALLATDTDASPTVTAVKGDDGTAEAIRKQMKALNIRLAGGQQQLKGEIFRIGHMGYSDPLDIVTTIAALEVAAIRAGLPVQPGSGIQATEEEWIHASRVDHRPAQ